MQKFLTTIEGDRSDFMPNSVYVPTINTRVLTEQFELDTWEAKMAPNHDLSSSPINNSNYVYRSNLNGEVKRDGSILNTHVTDRYNIIQFNEGAKWFEYFTEEGLVTIESALIYEDTHFAITCDLGLEETIQGEDKVERYLILGLAHTAGFPRVLGFTDIRPICVNTLHAASAKALGKASAAFSLDGNHAKALSEAKATINFQERRFREVEVPAYRELTKIKTTEQERELLFRKLLGLPMEGWDFSEKLLSKYEMLSNSYYDSPGMELFDSKEHSGWRVLQAVTWFAKQHDKGLDRFKAKFGSPLTKNTYEWLADRLPVGAVKVGSKFSLV
jgi:hypothetical protein